MYFAAAVFSFHVLPMHDTVSLCPKNTLTARLQPVSFEINNLLLLLPLLLLDDDDIVGAAPCVVDDDDLEECEK